MFDPLTSKDTRKPYSMVLSLLIQIAILAALCLAPFVFTQVLAPMQLKSVLAAPPKPLAVLVNRPASVHFAGGGPRLFRLTNLQLRINRTAKLPERMEFDTAPVVDIGSDRDGVPFGVPGTSAEPLPQAVPPEKPKLQTQEPIRVASMSAASLIHMVQPLYPPIALATHLQGTVEFTATISKEGTIENLSLVRGHPMLVRAARDAVLQWRYKPPILNGEPVEVITDIVVNFTLNQ